MSIDTNKLLKKRTVLQSEEKEYKIESVLGTGGFGITYKAIGEIVDGNLRHKVPYAIKEFFMSSICDRDDNGNVTINAAQAELYNSQKKAFIQEATSLHNLPENEGIVRVNEVFEANNTTYYVMEYLDEVLNQYVEEKPNGRLEEEEAMDIFTKIAKATEELHNNYRLHLDIKPGNIMLRGNGHPCLIDFGQSRVYKKNGTLIGKHDNAGSDGYAPLEQYKGIEKFAPSADIYALGATLLYMLTGQKPVSANIMSDAKINEVLPAGISEKTKAVLYRSLSVNPEGRYQSVGDLLLALGLSAPGGGDDATTVFGGKEEKKKPKPKKKSSVNIKYILGGVIGAAVIAGIVFASMRGCEGKSTDATVDSVADTTQVDTTVVNTSPAPDPQPVPTPAPDPQPVPTPVPAPQPVPTPTPVSTPSLDYADWTGSWKNGKPDGRGEMKFKKSHILPGTSIQMFPGDVAKGRFYNGSFVRGDVTQNGETQYIEIEG